MIQFGKYKIAVVIFSAGRHDIIKTTQWLDDERIYLCVPESQADLYQTAFTKKIIHPDQVNRLYLKIQWVLDSFRGSCDAVVKIDDDIEFVRDYGAYFWADKNIDEKMNLSGDELIEIVGNLFILAKDLGAYVFGFGNLNRHYYYDPNKRFQFLKAFDSSMMGYIFEDKIKIDESIKVKNEYDLQLQNLFHYGKVLVDNRYRQIKFQMNKLKGGMSAGRNSEMIQTAKELLQNKWGNVIRFNKSGVSFVF